MRRFAHKIGACFYILWGILHIWAGAALLTADNSTEQLDLLSTAPLAPQEWPANPHGLVYAALRFHAYNLLWFGLFALVVATTLNWKNSRTGYWLNLSLVGADDIGLLAFFILPGYLSFADAGLGSVLFALAFIFSTIGLVRRQKPSAGHISV